MTWSARVFPTAAADDWQFNKFRRSLVWGTGGWSLALLLVALPAIGQKPEPDQFTPVIASPLTASAQPFAGTDGKYHVVYELMLTNTKPTTATLKKIEVLDGGSQGSAMPAVIATYEGDTLMSRLRTLANTPAGSPEIEFDGTRLLLVDLTFDSRAQVPVRLRHRFEVMGASTPAPAPMTPEAMTYTVAALALDPPPLEIGSPLRGTGWVAINGCCEPGLAHRGSGLCANGHIAFGQRFAIDWMRLDEQGRLVHGDPADVHNYSDYGVDVLAVADGTVVDILNTLNDQSPGELPDPKTITIENVDGNHVVLDIGNGIYAFYAHLEKGSIPVTEGQHVKRGEVLGKLGNTGNTSAPHLHFHLMDGPSPLASNGIPYVIDSFTLAGQIPVDKDPAAAPTLVGSWSSNFFPSASQRHEQFPLDLNIVDFSGSPAGQTH
ncbi:MAG TPA: M23 family metallopeptidase [Terracidiphilus sp.]